MLSVKQGGIKYHFWVFGMTRPGTETQSPGPFYSLGQWPGSYDLLKLFLLLIWNHMIVWKQNDYYQIKIIIWDHIIVN